MAIIKYKKGNSWISIPIYVNTGSAEVLDYVTKSELESMGYISELKTINNQSLIGSGNINIAVDLSNYYTKSEVNGLIPSLDNYYKKSETYSQSEVNALIDSVNAGDVGLSNYYTKSEVDELIPDDYLTSSSLSGYATQTWVNNKNYASASDIPTNVSELANDMNYLTSVPSEYITNSELTSKLSSYAKTSAIPTATSDLTNDMGYLTSVPSEYITDTELTAKGYLTSADLEDATSPIVRSYNEFYSWDANLNTSTSVLEIVLNGNTAIDPLNNYSEVLAALKTENKIIHIGSESLGVELVIHPVKMENSYNSTGIIHGRIKDTELENQWYQISGSYSSSLSDSASYASTLYIQPDSYMPVDMQQVTYSQLKTYADNGKLIPGRKYAITDYSCIYIQPVSEVEMEVTADDIKQIICTAITTTTLSETVEIVRSDEYVPIIECKYSIDPESKAWTAGMTSKSPKGVIWYMKDANGNECNYDFKHVKFRRWAITDITPNDDSDTGSGNPGAYAYCVTDTSYNWSDNRTRMGSGEATDQTIVENVFAGTWAHCIPELTNSKFMTIPGAFHSDYALHCHKPYQDTSDSYKKYISWTTDMTSSIGVNCPRSFSVLATDGETVIGSTSVYGNQKIIVSTSSYMDCYTFDYQGTDASERTIYNSSKPLIENVNIGTQIPVLSNTCFIISNNSINYSTTYVRNVLLPYSLHNTILMRSYGTQGVSIYNLSCRDRFQYNLIITRELSYVSFGNQVGYNYLCADITGSYFKSTILRQTMFGYYQSISTGTLNVSNLWYSSFKQVKYSSESSWKSPKDGMYTYDVVSDEFFGGNIVGPIQYGYFAPHVDRLTFRSFYNKGCRFDSNNQCCSLGECSYSNIGYAGLGQFIKYGKIFRSIIPINSFVAHNVKTSTGAQTWPSTTPTVPDLYGVTVSASHASVSNISSVKNSVSTDSSTLGLPRKVLYSLGGGNWGTTYEHGLEAILANTTQTTNSEDYAESYKDDLPPQIIEL